MKCVVFGIIGLLLLSSVAAVGNHDNNGCGVGHPPRVDFSHDLKKEYSPPWFVITPAPGRTGLHMRQHFICVEERRK